MRLSLRILLRRAQRENWQFTRTEWNVDDKGVGHAVYQARGPERTYSLIAFARDLPDEDRTDRVIATAWDATFTLFDGVPTKDDIHRLSQNVPHQEAGRISERDLFVTCKPFGTVVQLCCHTLSQVFSRTQKNCSTLAI